MSGRIVAYLETKGGDLITLNLSDERGYFWASEKEGLAEKAESAVPVSDLETVSGGYPPANAIDRLREAFGGHSGVVSLPPFTPGIVY
jgi:hypothetical protein